MSHNIIIIRMTSSGENKKKTSKAEAVTAEATRRKEEVELRKEGTHGREHVQILADRPYRYNDRSWSGRESP